MKKTLLITGASGEIGAATARLAANESYDIALAYFSNEDRVRRLLAELQPMGVNSISVRADVTQESDVIHLFASVERELGPVTHLVNSAGIVGQHTFLRDMTLESMHSIFDVNTFGTISCCREFVRRFCDNARGGAIVNVSSRASELGNAGERIHYAASKGAVDSFTKGLAMEVAASGIRVNAVRPGLIDTAIHAKGGMADRLERLNPTIPLNRIGTAQEVGRAILFLLADDASYITGTLLDVSGGR